MSKPVPSVAAIMVGTNERAWLERALGSLQHSRGRCSAFHLTVYYVDNGSRDGSSDFVRRFFPEVRLIENSINIGFAAANNKAIREALAEDLDYVFLINPDTWTPPQLLLSMTRFMQQWPSYGVVGPLQWSYHAVGQAEVDQPSYNAWTLQALRAGERHVFYLNAPHLPSPADPGTPRAPHTIEHAYVQGAALFARVAMLASIGLFDETYHTFYEETDLCRRARLSGWRVALLSDLGIYHKGAGGESSAYRRTQMMRNKYYFLLTDIDLRAADMITVGTSWLRSDLAGEGVGGSSSRSRAWLELARSAGWLAGRIPSVASQRSKQRALRRRRHPKS